ncbi:hypothetical protein F7725_014361 [Dissostichus mawsoni]|uniref:Cytidyltransferase-like domain-containing protein n=1 Tax=Dissostichus mawsoni TaxID=36200 RepID=A0A7J5YWU4_DISMA|nr:hypothetical protein F7725_014361 [Dissostichus mawsoni]
MAMFTTGILVLTSPLNTLPLRIAPVLSSAAQLVERTLYVHLHPGLILGGGNQPRPVFIPPVVDLSTIISRLYSNAADVCGHLDVRVLLTNVRAQSATSSGTTIPNGPFPRPQSLSHSPDVVLTDFPLQNPAPACPQCCFTQLMMLQETEDALKEPEEEAEPLETYSDVVVGGTFDRLHGAHKTLLNISCLLANRRFLIEKVLKELVEPYSVRVQRLQEFLQEIKPSLQVEIVPLDDPYGVSVVDPLLQCIVVSEETRKGGEAVNKKRIENGLPALVLHEIQLLKDAHHTETEEEKISSSSLRSRLLGTLLTPPKEAAAVGSPAAGRRLLWCRVDCDKLGHEVYQPDTAAHHRVLKEFGSGKQVCVLDAAVLLEAGWTDMTHEVWVTIIPEEEAVIRITERDGVTTEDALRRLQSQWSNSQQVERANVMH